MDKQHEGSLHNDIQSSKPVDASDISGEPSVQRLSTTPAFPVANPKKTHTHILTKPTTSPSVYPRPNLETTIHDPDLTLSSSSLCETSAAILETVPPCWDEDVVQNLAPQLLNIFEAAILRGDKDKLLVSRIKKFLQEHDEKEEQIIQFISRETSYTCCLAFFYEFGISVPVDSAQALALYKRSALEDPIGQFCLGLCFYEEKGISKVDSKSVYPKDHKKCFYWMKRSAEAGCARGQCSLGYCYVKGIGVTKDETKSLAWFQRSAEGGCALGQANLGLSFEKGIGCTVNKEKAFYYYGLSAREGNSKGQCCLGLCYDKGIGCVKDEGNAFYWYSQSAYSGNTDGQYYLANCYLSYKDIKDEQKAHYWYKRSADEGDTDGMCMLGHCKQYGWGTPCDVHDAIRMYRRANKYGNRTAIEALTTLFYIW